MSDADLRAALDAARLELAANPRSAPAHARVGYLLGRQERFDEALAELRAALAIAPADWQTLSHLSAILLWLDRPEEMLAPLEAAVRANPGLAPAHQQLGSLLNGMGRSDEARRALERAVTLEPRNGSAHLACAQAKTYAGREDAHLALMEQMLKAGLPEAEQIGLQFALAKARGDLGEHDRAFQHAVSANRMARRRFRYDEAHTLASLAHTAEVFTAGFLGSRAGGGNPSPAPVFVVGMPRSGSSLMEQMLASHPGVRGMGETRAFLKAMAPFVRGFPDDAVRLDPAAMAQIGASYLAGTATGALRTTDKMLSNFVFAGLIHLALPNARIIHAVRDPVDTCLSCHATHFHEAQPYAYDLGELGRYYAAYRRLMDHWRAVLPAEVMLDVAYEDLVRDPEDQARRMVMHCGLEWSDACLEFVTARRPVWTASASQVRRPVYTTSVGRWRPPPHLLRPLLEGLGG
ncbi:MAG TPA: sulfotransferase [Rhizomicrobium sp.]|nr:sulfotransferase [Rhizomicrobium sp.]